MIILGLESSCDDTAAAVIDDKSNILASVVSSQDRIHARFGGIVPELASRRHMEMITTVVDEALQLAATPLEAIDLISVTQGPGLIGSLLVGFSYAKSLSYVIKKPFVGVDHLAGHLLSVFLEEEKPEFPYIALIVSGGTSALYRVDDFTRFSMLGTTRDDAAGEAFDKVARLLGLGYPGGPLVSRRAENGKTADLSLPRAWLEEDSLDFSFSGLKTAVMNHSNKCRMQNTVVNIDNLCAAFEEAIIDVLVEKTIRAARNQGIRSIVLGGGVSANSALRKTMRIRADEQGQLLYLPSPAYCTDNAAMIAFSGLKCFERGMHGALDDDVFSRSQLGR